MLAPLGLSDTFMFTPETRGRYSSLSPMLHGPRAVDVPLAMASFGEDGGLVSTIDDSMTFLGTFTSAQLFPPERLRYITRRWNRIFPPLRYGTGIMRFKLSPLLTDFRRVPALLAGLSADDARHDDGAATLGSRGKPHRDRFSRWSIWPYSG